MTRNPLHRHTNKTPTTLKRLAWPGLAQPLLSFPHNPLTLHRKRLNTNEPAPGPLPLPLLLLSRRGLDGHEPVLDAGAAAGAGDAVDADVGAARGGAHRVQQRRVLAPRVPVRRVPDLDPVARRVRVSDQRRELLCFFCSWVSVCLLVIVHLGGGGGG